MTFCYTNVLLIKKHKYRARNNAAVIKRKKRCARESQLFEMDRPFFYVIRTNGEYTLPLFWGALTAPPSGSTIDHDELWNARQGENQSLNSQELDLIQTINRRQTKICWLSAHRLPFNQSIFYSIISRKLKLNKLRPFSIGKSFFQSMNESLCFLSVRNAINLCDKM